MKEEIWKFVEYTTYDIRGMQYPKENTAMNWQYQLMSLIWISAQYIYWKGVFLSWK